MSHHNDLDLQDITETDAEMAELQKEVETWRRNYINVNVTRQEANALESRNTQLRQEIDRLGHTVKVSGQCQSDLLKQNLPETGEHTILNRCN